MMQELPMSHSDPQDLDALTMARRLAHQLATTARARDLAGGTPRAERNLLRETGLLKLAIPAEWGGHGASWQTVLQTVQIMATADASLAQVYGFQHVLLATCRLFGTPDQARRLLGDTVANNWFWGNALNPLDRRLVLATTPSGRVLRGDKSFSTGAIDSDMLIVSALDEGTGKLIVAAIPTARPGIELHDDWDNIGQRQTDSGSSHFSDVAVHDHEILGPPGPLGSTFATLRPCIPQLVFTHVFLGIAEAALGSARDDRDRRRQAARDPRRARHHRADLRGHRRGSDELGVGLRSVLAQRAGAHAARPRRLQGSRSRPVVPERPVADTFVLLVMP
jgi:alkylation response protein AidB-like acyl-CoA dehydrogenase